MGVIDDDFHLKKRSRMLREFCDEMNDQRRRMCSLMELAEDYAKIPEERHALAEVADRMHRLDALLFHMRALADRTEEEAKMLRDLTEIPLWKLEGNGDQ
jgi:hypothetical protein